MIRSSGVPTRGEGAALIRLLPLLVLVACTAAPSGEGSTLPSETGSDGATRTVSTVEVQSSTSTTEPSSELSEEEAVVEVMDGYAFPPDGPHPSGSVEFMEWLAFCEGAFGFEMEVVAEPGQDPYLYGQVTPGQDALHSRVRDTCRTTAVEAGHFFRIPHTEESGRRVYAGFMAVHECMVSHGFPVTDPPSEETFVADWVDGGRHWHPYDATPFGGSLSVFPDAEGDPPSQVSAQLEIQATCPADWATVLGDFTPGGDDS